MRNGLCGSARYVDLWRDAAPEWLSFCCKKTTFWNNHLAASPRDLCGKLRAAGSFCLKKGVFNVFRRCHVSGYVLLCLGLALRRQASQYGFKRCTALLRLHVLLPYGASRTHYTNYSRAGPRSDALQGYGALNVDAPNKQHHDARARGPYPCPLHRERRLKRSA